MSRPDEALESRAHAFGAPEPSDGAPGAARERLDAEPSLFEESAEDLYEEAPCGYLSTLLDGTLVRVNDTFLRWTGYRREDLVWRRRWPSLLTAGGRIYNETHLSPMLHMQGSVREIALDIVASDGRRLPVIVNSHLKRDASGAPVLVRTTVFDARERRKYEQELLRARKEAERSEARARILAQTLQRSLIPPRRPEIPGLDVGAKYRPAGNGEEVGGDFYDVFERARDDWTVVLGDVCGKGAEAATLTSIARYTVRATAMRTGRPSLVLATLNQALLNQQAERYSTVLYARIRRDRSGRLRLTVASGGHPLPYLLPADGGSARPFGRHGTLLGVFDDVQVRDASVELRPGDTVLLYTDGVTEGRGGEGLYGEERLAAVLADTRGAPAQAIADRLVEEVEDFQGGLPRDDIAVVVLRVP